MIINFQRPPLPQPVPIYVNNRLQTRHTGWVKPSCGVIFKGCSSIKILCFHITCKSRNLILRFSIPLLMGSLRNIAEMVDHEQYRIVAACNRFFWPQTPNKRERICSTSQSLQVSDKTWIRGLSSHKLASIDSPPPRRLPTQQNSCNVSHVLQRAELFVIWPFLQHL